MVPQWFIDKYEYRLKKCFMCPKPIKQKKRGRPRLTCSDACSQARYRFLHGKPRKRYKKLGKLVEARRALPFIERSFSSTFFEPIATLSEKRWMYECMACGTPYLVERIKSGAPIREYCSNKCEDKAKRHWIRFGNAMARSHLYRTPIDRRVIEREHYDKLSPLCPRCGKPFPPNTTLHGQRKRGRPRKYCSDYCRFEAYEYRWKRRNKIARRHRNRPCAECGTVFDRTDSKGRRQKRFCTDECCSKFTRRAYYAREKAKRHVIKRPISGRQAAIMGAIKNRQKRSILVDQANLLSTKEFSQKGVKSALTNKNDGLTLGAQHEIRGSQQSQAQTINSTLAILPTSMSVALSGGINTHEHENGQLNNKLGIIVGRDEAMRDEQRAKSKKEAFQQF